MHTTTRFVIGAALAAICSATGAAAQEEWTREQRAVLQAMERLSAATAPGGGGADAYGAVLTDDFTRWTLGSAEVADKTRWVEGVRDWFQDGWRVTDRETGRLEIHVRGDLALVRRVVTETYTGPDGSTTSGTAALAEVWIRRNEGWLLWRVDVRPLDG